MKQWIAVFALAGVFLCAPSAGAGPVPRPGGRATAQLKSVRLRPGGTSIQVIFTFSGPVRYHSTRSEQPPRITLEFPQTIISPVFTKRELLSVHSALMRVLISRSGGGTRAVIDLAAAGAHTVYASASDQLVVEIKTRPARVSRPPLAASPLPAVSAAPPNTAPPPLPDLTSATGAVVRVPWVPLGPKIEEFLSPDVRPRAARVSSFRQREPGDGIPVTEQTTAFLSYDNHNFYAVFVCHDESGEVRSHLVPREAINEDDQVALYLDTFHDGRHAYVFASNPFGVQQDGVLSDGDDENYTADMVWRSEGRLTSDGFVVLIAIPFKSLRFSTAPAQNWRIAISRTIARTSESAFWPYINRRVNGFVRQMAPLEGLELISPGRNVQLTPYGTFARTQSFDPQTAARTARTENRHGGLDAKVVVKNAVTIDTAINPDFSEVESDDPLVAVNQRYELFVPEKRPLFMENAGVFETPIKVFFSRRISDPDAGIRIVGRSTGWAFGGLVANDRGFAPRTSREWLAGGAGVGVLRVQRHIGEQSNLGVLATERDDGAVRNRVVSADTRLQLGTAWSSSAQVVQSDNVDGVSPRQTGVAFTGGVSRTGPHFTYAGSYSDVGSDFRASLGFVPRVDVRTVEQYAGYVWRFGDSGSWSVGPAVSATANWNHVNQLQDRWTTADIGLSSAGRVDARFSRADGYEIYVDEPFRTRNNSVSFWGTPSSWLSAWGMYVWGTAVNYTPAPGLAPFAGRQQGMYATVTLRPSTRLSLDHTFLHEQLNTAAGWQSLPAQSVFNTSIIRLKANLQVTRSLAFRGIVDYNQLDSDQSLFSDSGWRTLSGDALVRYVVNPGTALYIGVNNRYENLVRDLQSPTAARSDARAIVPVGRQVFVKMSYLFRF
jgi:hypothetical protein